MKVGDRIRVTYPPAPELGLYEPEIVFGHVQEFDDEDDYVYYLEEDETNPDNGEPLEERGREHAALFSWYEVVS